MTKRPHTPVLLDEVLKYLKTSNNEVYVDCTFGSGGYSEAILKKTNANVYAIDIDPEASALASKLKKDLGKKSKYFHFIKGNFADIESLLNNKGISLVDGIIADLGVSSMQIDKPTRGFSFQKEGPLDMRMSQLGTNAYDVINNYSEKELSDIIYKYGEENKSRQIARAIIKARETAHITTTTQLSKIIQNVFTGQKKRKIDFATKTFQAIRIWINNELENLKKLLEASEKLLKNDGRLIIISFHALEDRIVKNFLQDKSKVKGSTSRYLPSSDFKEKPSFKIMTKKVVTPSNIEINNNIRSRSAKLRVALRINRERAYE